MTFNFGVVLYKNTEVDIIRLCDSIGVACKHAGLQFTITLLRNSGEELSLPSSFLNKISIIDYSENLGFGEGHNRIVASLCDQVGFYVGINPDGFLSPWAMKAVLRHKPISGNLYEFQQTPQEHPKVFDPETGETAWVSGAAFMIDIAQFKELGGFDGTFFMYCEDVDLSWRVREAGGTCIMMADALFSHDVSDNRQLPKTVCRMLGAQVLLARKWGATRAERKVIKDLRKFEAQNGLAKTDIPELPENLRRQKVPEFCDFESQGSYSAVRW